MTIDASAVARVVGIDTEYKDLRGGKILYLPQRIAIVAQGASASVYATTKRQITSAGEAGSLYGYGSPIHLAARQLFPVNGDGVGTIPVTVYPLVDDASGVAAAGDITPSGTQTKAAEYRVYVNNIASEKFVIPASASLSAIAGLMTSAINAVLEMPVIAATATTPDRTTLTAKWEGVTGNDIYVEVVGESLGVTFTVTQPTGGLANPDITSALAQMGNVWETMVLNGLDIADTTALDLYQTTGEGRWGELVRKPFVAFTGNTEKVLATATTVSDARPTDRINAQLVAPGSNDLPVVVAARQLARIAKVANNNPPRDYGSQQATGLTPGDDGDQWDYATRDAAVKAGSSTIEVRDGVVNISDVITFYKPTGEEPPGFRYVCDIVKLMNVIFNLDLIFATAEWDGAPMIPDSQPTTNSDARKPKHAISRCNGMIDNLGLAAIISDPKSAKKLTVATINAMNPKRLDVSVTVQLSGNTNIKGITLNFGFYFGTLAAA